MGGWARWRWAMVAILVRSSYPRLAPTPLMCVAMGSASEAPQPIPNICLHLRNSWLLWQISGMPWPCFSQSASNWISANREMTKNWFFLGQIYVEERGDPLKPFHHNFLFIFWYCAMRCVEQCIAMCSTTCRYCFLMARALYCIVSHCITLRCMGRTQKKNTGLFGNVSQQRGCLALSSETCLVMKVAQGLPCDPSQEHHVLVAAVHRIWKCP